jgi:hypothetical protein
MTGAWACIDCARAQNLDTEGQAYSHARPNWCGAGGHQVLTPVRWAPGAKRNGARFVQRTETKKPEPDERGQWGLL